MTHWKVVVQPTDSGSIRVHVATRGSGTPDQTATRIADAVEKAILRLKK